MSVFDLADDLVNAWRVHPNYNGDDDDPWVRLVVEHDEGPNGNTWSITFCNVSDVAALIRRIERIGIDGAYRFLIEPIESTDVYSEMYACHWWDFPNRAGFLYRARAIFKDRFPKARTILNKARRSWRQRLRDPSGVQRYESKRERFENLATREGWTTVLKGYGLSLSDVWAVATNDATPADVEAMGHRQLELLSL